MTRPEGTGVAARRPADACSHRFVDVLVCVEGREHQDACAQPRRGEPSRRIDPVGLWHAHVHQHDVGVERPCRLDRLGAVAGLADDLDGWAAISASTLIRIRRRADRRARRFSAQDEPKGTSGRRHQGNRDVRLITSPTSGTPRPKGALDAQPHRPRHHPDPGRMNGRHRGSHRSDILISPRALHDLGQDHPRKGRPDQGASHRANPRHRHGPLHRTRKHQQRHLPAARRQSVHHIHRHAVHLSPHPRSCSATFEYDGTITIHGGTRQYRNATGKGTFEEHRKYIG